jgi:CBS domain-containing protein
MANRKVQALLRSIDEADQAETVSARARTLPALLAELADAEQSALDIVTAINTSGERIAVRLLQLAELDLGDPPVPYAFAVAGSLARGEQILGSDQDNALVLSDDYREDRHGEYFFRLSEQVCRQLDECGYRLCPGDIMASNPRWRMSLTDWQNDFRRWIEQPEPGALVRLCIFFDLRAIHGDAGLVDALRREFLARTRASPLFQAHLAAAALHFRPALSWFGRLRFKRSEQGQARMNLKKHAITPVVDLARAWSLAAGLDEVGTLARLKALKTHHPAGSDRFEDLENAFETASQLRIAHQARQVRAGQRADYKIIRDGLTEGDERALRHSLQQIAGHQQALIRQFRAEAFQ